MLTLIKDAVPKESYFLPDGSHTDTLSPTACPVCRMALTPSNPHDECRGLFAIPAEHAAFANARWLQFTRVDGGCEFTFRDLHHRKQTIWGHNDADAVARAYAFVEGQRRAIARAGRTA